MHREREVHPTHRKSANETHPELVLLLAKRSDNDGSRSGVAGVYLSEEEARAALPFHSAYHAGEAEFFLVKVNAVRVEAAVALPPPAPPVDGPSDETTKP